MTSNVAHLTEGCFAAGCRTNFIETKVFKFHTILQSGIKKKNVEKSLICEPWTM